MPESVLDDAKENQSPRGSGLPYRSVFAVLTLDSVLIYDTHHDRPLAVVRGLHYAGLTDCCWSKDGMNLIVCSTDGYVSILTFDQGELGQVYTPPATTPLETKEKDPSENSLKARPAAAAIVPPESLPRIPPCAPGQTAVLEGPPAKRAKKTQVAPDLVSILGGASPEKATAHATDPKTPAKRALTTETDGVGDAVDKLTLEAGGGVTTRHDKPAKKKKRIQPLLVSS